MTVKQSTSHYFAQYKESFKELNLSFDFREFQNSTDIKILEEPKSMKHNFDDFNF